MAAAVPIGADTTVRSSTLDEPVLQTIWRDIRAIGEKLLIVVIPFASRGQTLRDWDLWGPLVLCCILAFILGTSATDNQSGQIFSAVFVLVWVGSAVVTINAKFLGSAISFFQSVCVMGYCIAPLVIAAIPSAIFKNFWFTLIITSVAWVWSTYASLRFFRGSVKPEREILVVYPVGLFYFFIAWMMVVGL
ncbi:Yip1 integral membrane protein, putative [Bodo saltans]|uniref:Protein YIPF n=1 Tax=Bodo saltans TaxID=75058 RepID=A0A0S4JG02_BODSA|nr:Yip1 integral membrane protein, putative [Bodo saltans]|eukprot:CUG89114.1 Yip1 integral membrane protein, putative [Bodo saltans]